MAHFVKVVCLVIALSFTYGCQENTSQWPKDVTTIMVAPSSSTDIKYYELNGSYQAMYKTTACYPAEDLINSLVDRMSRQGWNRLQENSLNPGNKNSWALGGAIYEQWEFFLEKGDDVHQWVDEWEDGQRNLVTYFLKFRTKRKGNLSISSNDCNLEVAAIYIPKEIRPTAADLESWRSFK